MQTKDHVDFSLTGYFPLCLFFVVSPHSFLLFLVLGAFIYFIVFVITVTNFLEALTSGVQADVTFKVSGTTFKAHKVRTPSLLFSSHSLSSFFSSLLSPLPFSSSLYCLSPLSFLFLASSRFFCLHLGVLV